MKWRVLVLVNRLNPDANKDKSLRGYASSTTHRIFVTVHASDLKDAHEAAVAKGVKVATEGYGTGWFGLALDSEILEPEVQ